MPYMYNQDSIIEQKVDFLKTQLARIQTNFRTNLKPAIVKYQYTPLTRALLENIQRDIDYFLERNDLKISVYVATINQTLVIVGRGLIDQLVWESIQ